LHNVAYTQEEARILRAKMQNLVLLSVQAKHDGVLRLQDGIATCADSFMRVLLGMLVDGIDPARIAYYGKMHIAASKLKGIKLIEAMANLEATLSINKGESPDVLHARLSAYVDMKEARLPDEEDKPIEIASVEQLATIEGIKTSYYRRIRLNSAQIDYLTSLPPKSVADLLLSSCQLDDKLSQDSDQFSGFINFQNSDDSIPIGDEKYIADILSAMPSTAAHRILEILIEQDAGWAEMIIRSMLSFDDIVLFESAIVKQILSAISPAASIRAFYGVTAQLWEQLANFLPTRTVQKLEYFRLNLVITDEDVKAAQSIILQEMRKYPVTGTVLKKLDNTGKGKKDHDQP